MQISLPSDAVPRGTIFWKACLVVVAIEVGLLLFTLPWTAYWDQNTWILTWHARHPGLAHSLLSPWLRGAISGLGLINLWNAATAISPFRAAP